MHAYYYVSMQISKILRRLLDSDLKTSYCFMFPVEYHSFTSIDKYSFISPFYILSGFPLFLLSDYKWW